MLLPSVSPHLVSFLMLPGKHFRAGTVFLLLACTALGTMGLIADWAYRSYLNMNNAAS